MALIASCRYDDLENEVSDYEINHIPSFDELQNTFHEFHGECSNLFKKCSKQNKFIVSLESKTNDMKMELYQVKIQHVINVSYLNLILLN